LASLGVFRVVPGSIWSLHIF